MVRQAMILRLLCLLGSSLALPPPELHRAQLLRSEGRVAVDVDSSGEAWIEEDASPSLKATTAKSNPYAIYHGMHLLHLHMCDMALQHLVASNIERAGKACHHLEGESVERGVGDCLAYHVVCTADAAKELLKSHPQEGVLLSENFGISLEEYPAEPYPTDSAESFYAKYRNLEAREERLRIITGQTPPSDLVDPIDGGWFPPGNEGFPGARFLLPEDRIVTIGSSTGNQKCVDIANVITRARDGGDKWKRANIDHQPAPDMFDITVTGQQVCATRKDHTGGWGMNLEIECTLSTTSEFSLSETTGVEKFLPPSVTGIPSMVLFDDVGPATFDGNRIKRVRIRGKGFKENQDMARVILRCQAHAREWLVGMVCIHLVESIVAKKDEPWMEKAEVVILPMANPDGFKWSMSNDRMWRKNRNTAAGACAEHARAGVDLNRNWNPDWTTIQTDGWHAPNSDPCDFQVYRGSHPMSEAETIAVSLAVTEGGRPSIVSDTHTLGVVIFDTHRVELEHICGENCRWTAEEETQLFSRVVPKISAKHGYAYTDRPSSTPGTMKDFGIMHGAIGFTIELRPRHHDLNLTRTPDGGQFGPPPSNIIPCAEEYFEGVKEMVVFAKEKHAAAPPPVVATAGAPEATTGMVAPPPPPAPVAVPAPPPVPEVAETPMVAIEAGTELTSKYGGAHNGGSFGDHLWVYKAEVEDVLGACGTTNCLKGHSFWLSKADGSDVTGPYEINHNNANDGTCWDNGLALHFFSSSTRFSKGYTVGDIFYLVDPNTPGLGENMDPS